MKIDKVFVLIVIVTYECLVVLNLKLDTQKNERSGRFKTKILSIVKNYNKVSIRPKTE